MTFVATSADHEHDQRGRRQDAETGHVAAEHPLAQTARQPSANRNIQTSATTLTTSGTVTKKPVMKRRRSQSDMVALPRPAAREEPARISSPAAMRYHANGREAVTARRIAGTGERPRKPTR